jgi:DNA-binding CsgD family transcriptional regulator
MTLAKCHDLIESLEKSETVEDIHSICSSLCNHFGFDRFQYGARIPTSFVKPYYIFISSYQNEWRERYLSKGYMTLDPAVIYCASHSTPFPWDRIKKLETENDSVRQFMGEASEFGLNSGISIPVHSAQGEFAMFSVASSLGHERANSQIQDALPFVHLFTAHLHETVRRTFEKEVLPLSKVHLTNRERECLLWTAEGKTSWEISHILDVSERTVVFHLQNVADKLKVVNRQQAVARAVALGILAPRLG